MANFVLVHGAFYGAWAWAEFAQSLRDAGHSVIAPDLPGAGDDSTPLSEVTLDLAARTIVDALKSFEEPSVLVGHSMGGIVATQAAAMAPELVSRLIYLAAFRPVDGESLLDLTNLPEGADDGVQANITITENPAVALLDPAKANYVLYHDVPSDVTQRAIEQLEPQPLALFATPVDIAGAELPPQEYVICNQDRAIPPPLQRLMAERNPALVHELDASHSPFYSMPDRVLDLINSAAHRSS